LRQLID
jgi:dynein heavy chain